MKKSVTIPLGASLRVKREDGNFEIYVFQGSDENGAIYIDAQGIRHGDVGLYIEIAIKTSSGWRVL
jgi:hypothetical protein